MKFLEFIDLMKSGTTPDKQKIKESVLKSSKPKAIRVVALCCAVAVLMSVLGFGGYFVYMQIPTSSAWELPEYLKGISVISSVSASNYENGYLKTSSAFEITTDKAIGIDEFEKVFELQPTSAYTVKKKAGNTFKVSVDGGLKPNTLYNIVSKSGDKTVYSWAFETQGELGITNSTSGEIMQGEPIWVEFTHSDTYDFEKHFSITPEIAGTFERYSNRWVFLPSSEYQDGVVYSVTISKDLAGANGTLGQDYGFNFCLQQDQTIDYCYANDATSCDVFNTEQTVGAKVFFKGEVDCSSAKVTTYKIASANEFISLHKLHQKNGLVASAIDKDLKNAVLEFEALPVSSGVDNVSFGYPQKLESGMYVSKIEIDGHKTYQFFQVTSLAVYSVSSNGDCAVWVNDTVKGAPLSAVAVIDEGGKVFATDKNGYASLSKVNKSGLRYATIEADINFVLISNCDYNAKNNSIPYYSYISTDCSHYRTQDTVKAFGFTQNRATSDKQLSKIDLICSWGDSKKDVKLDENGAFFEQFELPKDIALGGAYIDIVVENEVLATKYFDIKTTNGKVYNVSVTTDKKCYLNGDSVTYTIYAEHYDNTPVDNLTLKVVSNGVESEIATNSRGIATFSDTVKIDNDYNGSMPFYTNCEFGYYEPNGEQNFVNKILPIYKSSTAITKVYDDGKNITLEIKKLNKKTGKFESGDINTSIIQKVYKKSYKKTEQNEVFDTVLMQYTPAVQYTAKKELVETNEYVSEGGKLTIPYSIKDDGVYYTTFECADNMLLHTFTAHQESIYQTDYEYKLYGKQNYNVGDNVYFKLLKGEDEIIDSESVMISVISGDIITNKVVKSSDISFDYLKEYGSDAYVAAAYFDGEKVMPVELKRIYTNATKLNIKIETDKTEYKPNDSANLSIKVTDYTGSPAECELFVNLYKTTERESDDIFNLVHYSRNNLSPISRNVSTYIPYPLYDDYGYSYGDGSNGEIKSENIINVKTDSAGKAVVPVKLCDANGELVIDICAFDNRAQVGRAKTEVLVCEDITLQEFIADEMWINDDISFGFRVEGSFENAKYTAELLKDGVLVDTKSGTAKSNQFKNENFGKCEQTGQYSIKINVEADDKSAKAQKDFAVVDFAKAQMITQSTSIETVTQFSQGAFASDVTIGIFDQQNELYFTVLKDALQNNDCRLDKLIAKAAANAKLGTRDFAKILSYLSESGATLNNDNTTVNTAQSALIGAVISEFTTTDALDAYFESVKAQMPDTLSDIACALYNAAHKKPVLHTLNGFLQKIDTLSEEQVIYLALAYAYIGDHDSANAIYNEHIAPKIVSANGLAQYLSDTSYETEYMTMLTSIVASKISSQHAKELLKWILGSEGVNITGLCYAQFISSYVPHISGTNTVEVASADKKQQIEYNKNDILFININQADIANHKFISKTGESFLFAIGDVDASKLVLEYQTPQDAQITISADTDKISDGDTFFINVDIVGFKNGKAQFSLPHGIKVLSTNVLGKDGYITQTDKQITMFSGSEDFNLQIECYATFEGKYQISPITLINQDMREYCVSNGIEIEIQ